jgi:filamentous hemagglutinin family protein
MFSWWVRTRRILGGGLAVLLLTAGRDASQAEVVLDGKFGASGALAGPSFDIQAGLGATRGNNLFHSFAQFDLKAGETATFSGPANIQNVLSRVTGGSASSIDGAIRSGIAGANVFLINPSGILFGPNASVDVSGSFAASTANYLKLADGAQFVAALDADDSMLSTAPVVAFGFLDGAAGSLEVHGNLKAAPGGSLSVVGSTVSVGEGTQLEALGGQIQLIGASAPGEVAVPPSSSPPLGASPAPAAGSSDVVIRGGRLVVNNAQVNASATGGAIHITLTDGLEVLNGGQITTSSAGAIKGGDISISAPSVLVDGQDGPMPTRIAAETASDDVQGAGGNVIIQARSVELVRGSEISASTFGAADAGRVDITTGSLRLLGSDTSWYQTLITANAAPVSGVSFGAAGQIVIRANSVELGNFAEISASTLGDANAGSIDIEAGSLMLRDASIRTYSGGIGAGGDIRIHGDSLTLDGPFTSVTAVTTGSGNSGLIDLAVGSLTLVNDAAISASTYGDGRGGNVKIVADTILLDTATFQFGNTPGISASSNPSFFGGGAGQGGDVTIEAGSLSLRHGMTISTTTSTSGDGGSINISADNISMDSQSSIQSASLGEGRAGTLSLNSSVDVLLTGNSSISTSAPQSSGGDIRVQAGNEIQLFDSQITAQAGPGGGGNITLLAPSLIYLLDSTLTAQAAGDGGNLTIDPVFFILNRSGLISKSTTANGGNITILSDYFFQSESVIDASAPFGLPGTVSVSAPEVDLSGSLIGLPSNLLSAETQLRPDCGVRLTADISSFVVLGRGGLPLEPGGFAPSSLAAPQDERK